MKSDFRVCKYYLPLKIWQKILQNIQENQILGTRSIIIIIITKQQAQLERERERCCSKKSLSYCSTTDTYICYCTTYIFPFIDQLLLLILELQYCHFYEACIVKLQISLWVFDQRPKQTKPYKNSAYVIIYAERQLHFLKKKH